MVKNLKCIIDTPEKILHVNGVQFKLINNNMYRRSDVTELFPQYFITIEEEKKAEEKLQEIISGKDEVVELIEATEEIEPKELPQPDVNNINIIKPIKEDSKIKFSWYRFGIIGLAMIIIAIISSYLRIHGISVIFNINMVLSTILVVGFVLSEFAISALLLREIKSRIHHAINFVVLGTIQLILIGMSFVFEFSIMSNWVLTQKNEVHIVEQKENIYQDKIKDIDIQIKSIQEQISITPPDYISKRSRLTTELNKLVEKKNLERDNVQNMLADSNVTEKKINKTGLENTSEVLGVEETWLTKSVLILIAGILNILYVSFMYGCVSELKRRN